VTRLVLDLAPRVAAILDSIVRADLNGEPITERVHAPAYGKLFMPSFGGTRENGSHKGYGFAMIADIMSGILSGNGPGFMAPGNELSQFVMAFKIDAFVELSEFKRDMDALIDKIVNMEPAPGHERVYYAGLIEHEEAEKRRAEGIPYHREVVDWFNGASDELNLNLRWP